MWSLPDIQRLNCEALSDREKLERAVQTGFLDGRRLYCERGRICLGQLSHQLWYDVFSDDPKGILTQCDYHRSYGIPEGFFWCAGCHRLMAENRTWEAYSTKGRDGGRICIPCAAEEYIADEDNWIPLTDEDIAVVTFDTLRGARHLLGLSMPVPKQIRLFDSVTFDSASCGIVRGFNRADDTPEAAVEAFRNILEEAKGAGHSRALLILDGAYEFAFTIGAYVPAEVVPRQKAGGKGRKARGRHE